MGKGTFGVVRLGINLLTTPHTSSHFPLIAFNKSDQQMKYAVKSVQKETIGSAMYLLKRELDSLKLVDHPNIVKLYETYEDEDEFKLVMEYCEGGELKDRLLEEGKLTEKVTADILYQVISATNHLHENGIAHRDLKAENIMFKYADRDNNEIKLIDFGLSIKCASANTQINSIQTIVGTPFYVAPEVFSKNYND